MQLLFNHLHSLFIFSCILSNPFSCILSSLFSCILSYMFPYHNCFPSHLFPAHFSLPIFPVRSSHWRLFRKKLLHYLGIPTFSLPAFPYPCSLSEAVSGVWFARISSTAEFESVSLPTFPCPHSPIQIPYFDCFPSHFSLPLFPVRSSQWRLISKNLLHCWVCECFPAHLSLPTFPYPLSLFRLVPCPPFILPPLMIPCCLYKMLQWRIMCELFKWTEQPDYFLCTVCVPPPRLFIHF
jgi:hypothetical protein